MGDDARPETIKKLQKLAEIAKEVGYTQAQLALAWAISNTDVSTCLLGFTKIEQVEENLKALELYKKWDSDLEKKVNDALNNAPESDLNWRSWKDMKSRREEALVQHPKQ
jgi:aryl-alcohol dehydrogenase-like predicted oxidoreductase